MPFLIPTLHLRKVTSFKEGGKAVKPLIMEHYTTHVGYADSSDRIGNSFSISKKTWK
jgi:hypothetical protein